MDADLKALEEKLTRLIAHTRLLQSENLSLRQDLAQAQEEVKQLKGNMTLASTRLEALIGRLPPEDIVDDVALKESL